MHGYLLTWNPLEFAFEGRFDVAERCTRFQESAETWSTGVRKSIDLHAPFFLIRQGSVENKGIVGAGIINSSVRQRRHFDPVKARQGKKSRYADVIFRTLLDDSQPALARELLDAPPFDQTNWDTASSGIEIVPAVLAPLVVRWNQHLKSLRLPRFDPAPIPDVVPAGSGCFGDAQENAAVEAAAIAFVTQHFQSRGYRVTSLEAENLGYDLLCEKRRERIPVEVKGRSGESTDFVITANEVREARSVLSP